MWYSNKMKKKAYKKYPNGTEKRTLSEELSLTGMPPDMIERLGLKNKKDINVYRGAPPNKRSLVDRLFNPIPKSFSNPNLAGLTRYKSGKKPINIDKDQISDEFIFLTDHRPPSLVNNATIWNDIPEDYEGLKKFNSKTFDMKKLEFELNDLRLSASFNKIIYFLYSKNNATFPLYQMYEHKKILSLDEMKSQIPVTEFLLWDLIKTYIQEYGFSNTIKLKKSIIEKVKDEFMFRYISYILDVRLKTNNLDAFDIYKLNKDFTEELEKSNLSDETKFSFLREFRARLLYLPLIRRDVWIPPALRDELYNFYGERFLRDMDRRDKEAEYERNYGYYDENDEDYNQYYDEENY